MNEPLNSKTLAQDARKTWRRKYQIRHGKGKTPAGHRIGKKGGKGARGKKDARREPIRSYYKAVETMGKALAEAIQGGDSSAIETCTAAHAKAVTGLGAARRAYAKGREDRVALEQKGLRVITP